MENKVLEENLKAVSRYDSNLSYRILTTEIEKSNFSISKTESGEYNLSFSNIPLHSEKNPIEESRQIASNLKDKQEENLISIVYGLGLGYLLDEISNTLPENKIILYEPNIELLKFVFEIAKIDAILKENVFVATNKNEFIRLFKQFANENTEVSVSFLNSYKMIFEKDIMNVFNISQKIIGEFCIRKNIEKKNHPALFFTFMNLKQMTKNPDISQLNDIYKGKTALVCSAGATLAQNIEIIKQNKDKVIVFALNQSLNLLIKNGIKPDFIVNIDAWDNRNQFKDIDFKDYYFIFEGFCHPKIFNMETKKTFNYISEGSFFNYWLRDCFSIKHHLISPGTVSISAFLSAVLMGFEKIILIGQDLAYKNGQCYSKGTVGEELECVFENNKYKIKPKDEEKFLQSMKMEEETIEKCKKRMDKYLKKLNENIYTIKGQDGNYLPTQTQYAYFADYFSQLAKTIKIERPDIELINSSTGGAQIDGFSNVELKEALKNLPVIEKLNLENIEPNYDKNTMVKKIDELYQVIEKFLMEFRELILLRDEIFLEIENKTQIDENLKPKIKKLKELVNKLLNYKGEKMVECIVKKRIETYIKEFSCDFENDIEALRNLILVMKKKKLTSLRFYVYQKFLTDCKSLILE